MMLFVTRIAHRSITEVRRAFVQGEVDGARLFGWAVGMDGVPLERAWHSFVQTGNQAGPMRAWQREYLSAERQRSLDTNGVYE